MRRTLLFVNGTDDRKFIAAVRSNADAIVLELEDGIPPSKKSEARDNVNKILMEQDFRGKERIVRVNPYYTDWGKMDVEVLLPARPDALRLTKCETAGQIREIDRVVTQFEKEQGLQANTIEFILTLETPLGIINAFELATSCPRVTAIGLGAGDLACSLDVDRLLQKDTVQFLYAKQRLVIAGKAAGVQIIDTTVISKDNVTDFVRHDTSFIRDLGFTGRSVSDLSHIDIINSCFTPSSPQVELAKKAISAYETAVQRGESDVFVDGVYLDPGIVDRYRRLLCYIKQIEEKESLNYAEKSTTAI